MARANRRFNRKVSATCNIDDAINLQSDIGPTLNASINTFETSGDKLRKINVF